MRLYSTLPRLFARIRKADANSTISQPRYGRNQPPLNHEPTILRVEYKNDTISTKPSYFSDSTAPTNTQKQFTSTTPRPRYNRPYPVLIKSFISPSNLNHQFNLDHQTKRRARQFSASAHSEGACCAHFPPVSPHLESPLIACWNPVLRSPVGAPVRPLLSLD